MKQEKLVFILVILYIQEYLCVLYIQEYLCVFTKLFTGTRVSGDFQFRLSGSRNNPKFTVLITHGVTPKPNLPIQSTMLSANHI